MDLYTVYLLYVWGLPGGWVRPHLPGMYVSLSVALPRNAGYIWAGLLASTQPSWPLVSLGDLKMSGSGGWITWLRRGLR